MTPEEAHEQLLAVTDAHPDAGVPPDTLSAMPDTPGLDDLVDRIGSPQSATFGGTDQPKQPTGFSITIDGKPLLTVDFADELANMSGWSHRGIRPRFDEHFGLAMHDHVIGYRVHYDPIPEGETWPRT